MGYFWVFGYLDGRRVLLGPVEREKADRLAGELDDGQVLELDTRDARRASQMVKAMLVERKDTSPLARLHHRFASALGRTRTGDDIFTGDPFTED